MIELFNTIATQITANFDRWVDTQVVNNDFLVAGLFTVGASTAIYLVRNVPRRIANAVLHRCTVTVAMDSFNQHFDALARELNRCAVGSFSRSLVVDGDNVTIGMGRSLARFRGRLCIVDREQPSGENYSTPRERITIQFLSRDRQRVSDIFTGWIADLRRTGERRLRMYSGERGGLSFVRELPLRPRESIFVAPDVMRLRRTRIDRFLAERAWYDRHGVPYKLAIILHGPPGTGKTTLARYLAAYARRDLVTLNLASLKEAVASINSSSDRETTARPVGSNSPASDPIGYVGLIEDIDCSAATGTRAEPSAINPRIMVERTATAAMSDILNAIDGVHAPDDFILIATTNHLEKLDPALVRKGRFDEVVHVGALQDADIRRMVAFHFPDAVLGGVPFEPITGAALQDLVMSMDSAGDVVRTLRQAPSVAAAA